MVGMSSCKGSGIYSAITKKCKLEVAYEGKNFITDGIGEAKLTKTTDGDTASFQLLDSGNAVTIRFYGIDTPESTGGVEKWGKSASMFVEKILKGAHSIVLEATTTPASHDSYGVRYLGYVWYRNSAKDSWKNLNLQVVENGFSENKCIQTAEYKYYTYFKEAADFAAKKQLHIWSDAEDPYYSDAAQQVTIKELIENIDIYYNMENNSGAKVHFNAYVKELDIGGSAGSYTYTFVVGQLIDGKEYLYSVYSGYSNNVAAQYIKIGNMYSFTGSVQYHSGSYQISGLMYVPLTTGGDYLYKIQDNYYCIFDDRVAYANYYGNALYSNAVVASAKVENNMLIMTASATNQNEEGKTTEFTFRCPVQENINVNELVGKSFAVRGYKYDAKENVIDVLNYSSFNFN